jgi:hypothetical protein
MMPFDADVRAVPTFEAAGIYWEAPGGSTDCDIAFRKVGESAWHQALRLWYDARNTQCRGSLVNLEPGTRYEARVTAGSKTQQLAFETRNEHVPVARVVRVPSGQATLRIREGGSAKGYVVYEGGGATLDAGNAADFNIVVEASYVVVRGFTLKGAKQDAIRLGPHVTDVVVEDNDISGWGRPRDVGEPKLGADMDSGVRAMCRSCPVVERITIQRNRIHDPRYSANSWSEGHPAGPQAISFSWCGGELVIRHNDITAGRDKRFNDAIGGEENYSREGFPNADSDIYGNNLQGAWDDGIESEGGNRNVRIWGNYIDQTATGIATTVTSVGPVYLFRNVWNRSRFRSGPPDLDERQPFFKAGSDPKWGDGRRYIFHNTMLQAREEMSRMPLGGGGGIAGTGADQPVRNTISRNNIFHSWRDHGAFWDIGPDNDFAYDLFVGEVPPFRIAHAAKGEPVYEGGGGWKSGAAGKYQLARRSPGAEAGVRIPNFNDGFKGKAPDIGAHEAGTPPMKFGVAASRGPAVSAP